VVGLRTSADIDSAALQETTQTLSEVFRITPLALIPLLVVFTMAMRKFPPLPTILTGALLGGVTAVVLQPNAVIALAASPALSPFLAMAKGVWTALANGYVSTTGVTAVDDLLTRGGMANMLTTIWLIICALSFGAVLEFAGMLERLIRAALKAAHSTGALIFTTAVTCIGANIVAADQYISIVLPGRMFKAEFRRRGLDPRNLSRVIEDCGTLTSPLVPWNTCGAYMSATLGVATFAYLPFAFFNLINPVVSVLYGAFGITITKLSPETG
jgi:NhaC family Na+:H+ antiporter